MPADYPVYVVDDDSNLRDWLGSALEHLGLTYRAFAAGDEFLDALDELEEGCILLDMRMPGRTGLAVQAELARRGSFMPVVAMTGFGDVDVAVRSMKLGAVEFLEKPFQLDVLREAVELGFARLRASAQSASVKRGRS